MLGFDHVVAHPHSDEAEGGADQERDPPTPGGQLVVSQQAREEGTKQGGSSTALSTP
jgi:hypothetical protein